MNRKYLYVTYGLCATAIVIGGVLLVDRFSKGASKTIIHPIARPPFFDTTVFDSPDQIGSGGCIDPHLLQMLQQLQNYTGYPIFSWINSGVRTPYWNSKVGGVANSSHKIPTCKAVDIRAANKTIRNKLVYGARAIGFKRIGVGNTFVHLDVDNAKSQYVAWGYPSGSKPEVNPFV